jgi:hypothetical protein
LGGAPQAFRVEHLRSPIFFRLQDALFYECAERCEFSALPSVFKGVLMQMESSSCGYAEKDGKTLAGEILGTDGQHKNTKQVLCQEYTLSNGPHYLPHSAKGR